MTDTIIVAVGSALSGLGIVLWFRNNAVARYRRRLIDSIHHCASDDIQHGREWQWRYDEYDTVSYERQLWQFWRRLDSFYPSLEFARMSLERSA